MFGTGRIPAHFSALIITALLVATGTTAAAQHHGGQGMGGGLSSASGRPGGVNDKDDLKDFHQAIAVQATSEQAKDFIELVKQADAAKELLSRFPPSQNPPQDLGSLDKAIADLCAGSRRFESGFSNPQKDGLKHTTKSLEKTTAQLEQETRRLDQAAHVPELVSAQVSAVARTLADFDQENLALGRQMSIVLASDQDISFSLPAVRRTASIGSRSTSVDSSGVLSQTGSDADLKTFHLSTLVDLSELQQAFSEILTAQLDQSGSCEKRVSLRQASIMGASPASSAVLRLHFERWSCRGAGQGGPMEIAEGDGTVELRLTPVVVKSESLSIASEIRRVDAVGMLEGELRSGDLGSDLREKVAAAILTAANAGLDAKTTLPAALQGKSTLRSARFEERAASGLNLMVDRELQLSSTQLTALTTQLNQAASEAATRQTGNP